MKQEQPKSRAADVKKGRDKQIAMGRKQFRAWVTPSEREALAAHLVAIRGGQPIKD